jgi:hypothetical protein
MTLIKSLTNSLLTTVSQEPTTEPTPQSQPQAPAAFGIANSPDLFEMAPAADPLKTGIFTVDSPKRRLLQPDRDSDELTSVNSKSETYKSEQQDAEARQAKGYKDIDDWFKEMRK